MALLLGLMAAAAYAESVEQLDVGHADGRYSIELQATLNAPLDDAYAVFSDFNNLPKINDAIESVEALPEPTDGLERWRTNVRVCISFFCTHLKQVQDVRKWRDGAVYQLSADVIPSMSNLRYGTAQWQLSSCGSQTCLHFAATLEPDFWVPPLIGPWVIERVMRRQAHSTAAGIERLALAHHDTASP
ncbi:SRPBCC family protein [Solimonas marina]|uniref:SRPBCC family protein n=1 Tax=Solimonas marina TaxID=2714601 RepID=A0A969WFU4_9GAMM|nr:SRPBCC family protein [Solimonas marina]NKF24526.1 SRPBCC family protein [Solimonas marina]